MLEVSRLKVFEEMGRSRKNNFTRKLCEGCLHLVWNEEYGKFRCDVYLLFWFLWCDGMECPEMKLDPSVEAFQCFEEERTKPLAKPGGGEKSDRTHKLFGKARMKDNRARMWDGKLDL